ncbi:hypothetical protein CO169_02285, partial [Candidatus Shapirobacteria bacterium CG_4_9_14_3_um_filter_39_13]
AFVNGEEEKIDYGNERGLMKLKLSEGQNLVKFKFLRTPLRLTSEIASLIGLLTTTFLFVKFFFKKKTKPKRKR